MCHDVGLPSSLAWQSWHTPVMKPDRIYLHHLTSFSTATVTLLQHIKTRGCSKTHLSANWQSPFYDFLHYLLAFGRGCAVNAREEEDELVSDLMDEIITMVFVEHTVADTEKFLKLLKKHNDFFLQLNCPPKNLYHSNILLPCVWWLLYV